MSDLTDTDIDDITADLLQLADSEGDVLARASAKAITALRGQITEARAENEGAHMIIAAERAEVLALRAKVQDAYARGVQAAADRVERKQYPSFGDAQRVAFDIRAALLPQAGGGEG